MSLRVWIPLKFPTVDEYRTVGNRSHFALSSLRREWVDSVVDYCEIRKDKFVNKVHKYPVTITFNIHIMDEYENISLIDLEVLCLDGLQKAGVIVRDSQQYVDKIEYNIIVDGTNGVEIRINEKL